MASPSPLGGCLTNTQPLEKVGMLNVDRMRYYCLSSSSIYT